MRLVISNPNDGDSREKNTFSLSSVAFYYMIFI
jgi:hypothetical protein